MEYKKINGVFEGGGVKGSGLVGAIAVTEQKGIWFENVAGTSAGAIVAALIAAGYTAQEIKAEIDKLDYNQFKDLGVVGRIPLIGRQLNLLIKKGIYEGDAFEAWLRELLLRKNVKTFGDLTMPKYMDDKRSKFKLQVIASDITRGRLLVLPNDIEFYGIKPEELDIVWAVRMSMSIPFFYKPVVVADKAGVGYHVVDGGLLSNFPVWLFDNAKNADIPTIGYKLVEPEEGKPRSITGPISLFSALFATMLEAHDARYIEDNDFERTIPIETLGIQTTDFGITKEQKQALHQSGIDAANKFFSQAGANMRKAKK